MPERSRPQVRSQGDFSAIFPHVSRETLSRLALYESLLRQWQPAVNLVSPATLDHIWHRHFADSAQLLALAPPEARNWLDLGSGAGFPGLVIAILLAGQERAAATLTPQGSTSIEPRSSSFPRRRESRHAATPNRRRDLGPRLRGDDDAREAAGSEQRAAEHRAPHVTLVESDARKAAFLREVARRTHAPATILAGRIEKAATQFTLPPMDVVTARALAPLSRLLALAHGFFQPNTVGLFLKGRGAEREVAEARERWAFEHELVPSLTDAEGRIVVVRALGGRGRVG